MNIAHAAPTRFSSLLGPMVALMVAAAVPAGAQSLDPRYYATGNPVLSDLWVDPVNGSDSDSGETRSTALRTVDEAWSRVPQSVTLTDTGWRILLVTGVYAANVLPNYMESRYGTYACPVVLQAADGEGTAILQGGLNIFDCRYLYLVDFDIITSPAGEALHGERCDHFLMHGMTLSGGNQAAQETVKMNQCQYVYLEDSDVSGAWNVAVDFVACQYGHIVGNRIHDAGDWACYLKGGSACFRVEANEFYDAGTGGFTAGQGTGFEFMVSPWLHYETYDIKVINNIIHDTDGAGLGVNGGYNILMAYNTLYRVGQRSHVIEVVFGSRSCDGDVFACQSNLTAGGWGTATPGGEEPIPDRNVYIYNNIVYNPTGYQSGSSQFAVYGPRTPSLDSNIPSPARTDVNLRIRGNIIWNGPADHSLGIGESDQGGQPDNATCNPAQLLADNAINTLQPQLVSPATGDYRPVPSGNVFAVTTYALPAFAGGDRPSPPVPPVGNLTNTVSRDIVNQARTNTSPPGAYSVSGSSTNTTNTAHITVLDYNGDGISEMTVYAESVGSWFALSPTGGVTVWAQLWGGPDMTPVPGDYDGDGRDDLTVYDRTAGRWYSRSVAGSNILWAAVWGGVDMTPVPGDYDGDGAADLAVYQEADGKWFIYTHAGSVPVWNFSWGGLGFAPVPGDYDGDGASDMALYDEANGRWFICSSRGTLLLWNESWGGADMTPVPGDYDGDGVYDLGLYDDVFGLWYVKPVSGLAILTAHPWGGMGLTPVPGDFDGDGIFDLGLYEASSGLWYAKTVAGRIFIWQTVWGGPDFAPVKE